MTEDIMLGWKGKTGIVLLVIILSAIAYRLIRYKYAHLLFIGFIVIAFLYVFVIRHWGEI